MKLILIFFLIGINTLLIGQNSINTIIYSAKQRGSDIGKDASKSLSFKNSKKEFIRNVEKLQFELIFSDKEANFRVIERLFSDRETMQMKMALLLVRGNGFFYTNLDKNIIQEQKETLGEFFIIEKKINQLEWILESETKKIGDYTCYKATGIKYGRNRYNEITEVPITIWYAPELPYRVGPFEAAGLPGLVLQYDLGTFSWKADRINLRNKNYTFEVPNKGEILTEEELNDRINGKAKHIRQR